MHSGIHTHQILIHSCSIIIRVMHVQHRSRGHIGVSAFRCLLIPSKYEGAAKIVRILPHVQRGSSQACSLPWALQGMCIPGAGSADLRRRARCTCRVAGAERERRAAVVRRFPEPCCSALRVHAQAPQAPHAHGSSCASKHAPFVRPQSLLVMC